MKQIMEEKDNWKRLQGTDYHLAITDIASYIPPPLLPPPPPPPSPHPSPPPPPLPPPPFGTHIASSTVPLAKTMESKCLPYSSSFSPSLRAITSDMYVSSHMVPMLILGFLQRIVSATVVAEFVNHTHVPASWNLNT